MPSPLSRRVARRAHRHPDVHRHRLSPLARAVAASMWLAGTPLAPAQTAPALPTGAQVQAGQASITTQGAQMTVRNTPATVLNWQSFNIGAGAGVHFEQAGAASRVLNRVVGADPSLIQGSLTSNGQVWLLNPHGVLFGPGARVDVAGLVAGTLRLNDNDFLAGRYRFAAAEGDAGAAVRNEGTLRTVHGGQLVLLGPRVENAGDASAPGGHVALLAGRSVDLVDTGLPHLVVRLREGAGEVLNAGRLAADGGRVDLHAAIVNQAGLVRADTLAADAQGRIVLRAADTLTLADGSVTAATAAADAPATATGGAIDLLGTQVALVGHALVDVSGAGGGGSIRLGGGLQGRDASVPNARAVYVGRDAELRADATGTHGDGGRIVVWSDEATRAYGGFSARGGAQGGDGGFVETSGGWLDARPAAMDLSAPHGRAGSWLLDPFDLFIFDSEGDGDIAVAPGPVFTSNGPESFLSTATLAAALNAGTSVRVVTGAGGTQPGDIVMDDANLVVAPALPVTLTLEAARDIVIFNSTVETTQAPLSLSLVSGGAGGTGLIGIEDSRIVTNGGDVTLAGAAARLLTLPDGTTTTRNVAVGRLQVEGPALPGIEVRGSDLLLGNGAFTATGQGPTGSAGVLIREGVEGDTTLAARRIDLFGFAPTGTGVRLSGDTTLTATQTFRVDGAGVIGVQIEAGARLALNAAAGSGATFTLIGRGGDGQGVLIAADVPDPDGNFAGRGSRITVVNGALDLQATSSAEAGIVMLDDAGAPGPLFDLAGATGATFNVPASAAGALGATSIFLGNVDLALPAAGSTTFAGNLGVVLDDVGLSAGSGTLAFGGASVALLDTTLAGAGLAVSFATTGALPQGVLLQGASIATGGGDVVFGAQQNVTSPLLGATTTPAHWVEQAGVQQGPALALFDSTIDAGAGIVRGGGADRVGTVGTQLVGSSITARQVHLAGRSEAQHGVYVAGSSLAAIEQLSLDGRSAAAFFYAGLNVVDGSTLQLVDPTPDAASLMRLGGEARFGGRGVAIGGGSTAGEGTPTLITVGGASLLMDGVAVGNVGLQLAGDGGAGALTIDAAGASAVTLRGATSGVGGGATFALRSGGLQAAPAGSPGGGPSPALTMDSALLLGPASAGATTLLDAAGALTLANVQIAGAGPLTLLAQGAGVNGSLLSLLGSTLTTAAALTINGQATSGGIGVSLLSGNALSGGSVAITGAGIGGAGVSFAASAGTSTVAATAGNLLVNGGPAAGAAATVAFSGGWSLQASDTVRLQLRNALPITPGAQGALLPSFSAGRALEIAIEAPGGLAIGPGEAIDSALLSNVLAGMPAASTVTLRAGVGSGTLALRGAVDVPSKLELQADRIDIEAGGSLASGATGDAIVLGGASTASMARFTNASSAGGAALAAPNGRWVLLVDDPRQVVLGGLTADFTAYGLSAQPLARDADGNFITTSAGNLLGVGLPVTALVDIADPVTPTSSFLLDTTRHFVLVPLEMSTPTKSRLLDAALASEGGEGTPQRALDWSSLSREEAISLLAARARYKQKVFARGVYRLQQDPRLAEAPACTTEAELETGLCIVTPQLKSQIQTAR
ncbi:MAG: filamentous hemagglutinin N-terminal domain-containing protein, partial [Rubrivivax sp.]|nr:filamentous hemagglutinin N-terminal domain-containing protein [Rubrivivax sp.]